MRDLLVLCSSLPPTPALNYAASLATLTDASVTGLHVCEPITLLVGTTMPAAASLVAAYAQERLARARLAAPDFARWATQAGVAGSTWLVAQGSVPETVAYAANWHDLLLVERNDLDVWGTINAIAQLVLGAGIPVLALPHEHADPARLDCIAIAWNGSPESTRALHSALPLLSRARRVVLMRGRRHPPFSPIVQAPKFDVDTYLERHGIRFDDCPLDGPDDRSGHEILEHASDMGAGLLVMGGCGRNRFSEWVLGSATRHVLREARIPVLLRH